MYIHPPGDYPKEEEFKFCSVEEQESTGSEQRSIPLKTPLSTGARQVAMEKILNRVNIE